MLRWCGDALSALPVGPGRGPTPQLEKRVPVNPWAGAGKAVALCEGVPHGVGR